ncbi:MAG: EAL domain-containing protein [Clostridiales bacterium]|nr:EAL domain-containing protein [Clostridiales bacterium]
MKSKFKSILNNISINKKLLFITIVGAILPIAILLLLVFSQMKDEFETRKDVTIDSVVEKLHFDVSIHLSNAENVIQGYLKNVDLLNLIDSDTFNDELQQEIESKIALDIYSDELIKDIIVYVDGSHLDYSSDYFKPLSDVKELKWYKDIENQRYYLNIFRDNDEIVLTKSLNARDYHSQSFIKVVLNSNKFMLVLNNELLLDLKGKAYIVDPHDSIVSSNYEIDLEKFNQLSFIDKSIHVKKLGNDYFFSNWKLYVLLDNDVLSYDFWEKIIFILTFVILIVSVLLVLNYNMSKSISSRLKIINKTMLLTGDDVLSEIDDDMGRDEIGQTALVFNSMINHIKSLILEVKTERDKSDQLLSDKTKAYDEINTSYEKIRIQTDQINDLVYNDLLTGIKNRFAITKTIEEYVEQESGVGVLFLDVDNFKFINDTYGHDLGDLVIMATAKILLNQNHKNVEIGRFGGDEFLIVMSQCTEEELMSFAQKIQESFMFPVIIEEKKFYLTVSIGGSLFPDHGSTHMDLIKKADLALYDAKDSGRNLVRLYRKELDLNLEEKMAFQNAIKEALSNNEFYLNYQPYYNTHDFSLAGYEALIRWFSKEYGQVSPYKLITQVESMGLIIDLGDWIIKEAFKFAKKVNMLSDELVTVSINISIIQLLSHDFYNRLLSMLKDLDIPAEMIVLEMTETILIDSIDSGANVVEKLRNAGFGIALDDFGTGYSSLSYLSKMPVSIIKIDKSFIDHVVEDDDFAKTIIHLAHKRSLTVVAEGVETIEQVDILKDNDCDVLQGYYFNKPMSEEDAITLCKNSKSQ